MSDTQRRMERALKSLYIAAPEHVASAVKDAVQERIAELEAVVREVEWNGISFNRYGAGFDACPCCAARVRDGHVFGCRLAAAIATDTPTAAREAGEGGEDE